MKQSFQLIKGLSPLSVWVNLIFLVVKSFNSFKMLISYLIQKRSWRLLRELSIMQYNKNKHRTWDKNNRLSCSSESSWFSHMNTTSLVIYAFLIKWLMLIKPPKGGVLIPTCTIAAEIREIKCRQPHHSAWLRKSRINFS